MFRYLIYRYLCFVCLFAFSLTSAGQSLYSVDLPIANRHHSTLAKALTQALTTVFIRMSGNKHIATLPSITPYLQHPKKLLHAYHYHSDQTAQLTLHSQFSATAVNHALQAAGQGIWSTPRPQTVVSIFLNGATADPQAINSQHLLAEPIQHTAKQRGLPIRLALMDLQDINYLSALKAIETSDTLRLQKTAAPLLARYQADYALVGYIQAKEAQCWSGHFIIYHKNQVIHWHRHAHTAEQLLQQAIDKLADQLAEKDIIVEDQALTNVLTLTIKGVDNYVSYQQLIKTLHKLAIIDSIQPSTLSRHSVSLKLRIFGDSPALERKLIQQLGTQLTPNNQEENNASLVYQWHNAVGKHKLHYDS